MKELHVKKGDTVIVLTGEYKDRRTEDGKVRTAKVVEVAPDEGKVIVEGIHTVSKHVKPRKQGEEGGILQVDAPIYACKVQLYCSKCEKGVRAKRVMQDGKKVRVCAKCGNKL